VDNDEMKKSFLTIDFESNRDFKKCPYHFKIFMKNSIKIIANAPLLNEVTRTMNKAM
jgi:hypothetical protein